MADHRLFAIAPDAISVTCRFEHPDGWSVVIASSTAGPHGRTSRRDRYDRLSTGELVDVIDSAVLAHVAGVPGGTTLGS